MSDFQLCQRTEVGSLFDEKNRATYGERIVYALRAQFPDGEGLRV